MLHWLTGSSFVALESPQIKGTFRVQETGSMIPEVKTCPGLASLILPAMNCYAFMEAAVKKSYGVVPVWVLISLIIYLYDFNRIGAMSAHTIG